MNADRSNRYIELANGNVGESYIITEEFYARTDQSYIPMKLKCEQLYRVISLIAYGNTYEKNGKPIGLATWKDIEKFCYFNSEDKVNTFVVELPIADSTVEEREGTSLPIPSAMRGLYSGVTANTHAFSDCQTFTLFSTCLVDEHGARVVPKLDARNMAAILGQLIANKFVTETFRGWFDGKPQMESNDEVIEAWITLASLPRKSAPRLCQCCGKALDGRVGSKGGRRALTCSKSISNCSATFNNEQRRLVNENDPAAGLIDTLEQKAREVRWRDNNDARPLEYPVIELPRLKAWHRENSADINTHVR